MAISQWFSKNIENNAKNELAFGNFCSIMNIYKQVFSKMFFITMFK